MTTPLYRTIQEELRARIEGGVYARGGALPSEGRLREEFGVSLITLRRALHELALDGLVESRQGIGHFVREASGSPVTVGLSNFTSQVASGRLRLVRTLMADEVIPASADLAARLGVQPDSLLRHLTRLDREGGSPMSVDEVFIPPARATGITASIASSPLFMHLWQHEMGLELVRTYYEIWVEPATKTDRALLQLDAEIPLLATGELIYDANGQPAAWVITRYRGDRCRLSGMVMLTRKKTRAGVVGE